MGTNAAGLLVNEVDKVSPLLKTIISTYFYGTLLTCPPLHSSMSISLFFPSPPPPYNLPGH